MPHLSEPEPSVFDSHDIEQNRAMAALSYVWVLWLIPLLIKRDSAYAQFHARQGLTLFVAEAIAMLLLFIPILNFLLFFCLLLLAILGITNALKGVALPLPIIGRYSRLFRS